MADGRDDPAGDPASASSAAPRALEPLRYAAFREVWVGNATSQLGSQIQSVAAAWLMTELTTRHALVAAVPASTAMPMLLLSVFAGVLADNFDRRRIMLVGQWAMLVVSAALAALTYAGKLGAWGLLGFTLAVGSGMALILPSWSASVRALVPDRRVLPQAIALNSISFNLARSLGPALGGLVLATAGVAAAFAINALSYIAMIIALMRWKPDLPPPQREPLFHSVKAGVSFCWHSGPVRRVLMRGSAYGFGAIGVQAMLPIILRGKLDGGEAAFGFLLGAFGVGSIVGAFTGPALRRHFGAEQAVALAAAASTVALVGLAEAWSIGALMIFVFMGGAGWTMSLNTFNVAMQVRSPHEILGRCMAIYQAVTLGSSAIGAWAWGFVADATSAPAALLWAAVWLGATTVILRMLSPLPARGEGVVPEPEIEPDPAQL